MLAIPMLQRPASSHHGFGKKWVSGVGFRALGPQDMRTSVNPFGSIGLRLFAIVCGIQVLLLAVR